jgi:hypothetical protein
MGDVAFQDIKGDVEALVRAILEENLNDKVYRADLIQTWSKGILTEVLTQLGQPQFKAFKFVASAFVVSKDSNAFYTATHLLWDQAQDWSVTVSFSNSTLDWHVTVYGLTY